MKKSRQKIITVKLNNKGSSFIIVAMLSGLILAIFASTLPQLFSQMQRPNRQLLAQSSAYLVRDYLMAALDNDASWSATIRHPSNAVVFACDVSGAVCAPGSNCLTTNGAVCANNSGPINLIEADGVTMLFQQSNLNAGFTETGEKCLTHGIDAVKDNCTIRFNVQWSCNGPCAPTQISGGAIIPSAPKISFSANFIYIPKRTDIASVNLRDDTVGGIDSKYKFNFNRGKRVNTLSNYCNSLQGVFNSQTQNCQTPFGAPPGFDCAPPSWFTGFHADGTPQCMTDNTIGIYCPTGYGVVGYDTNGGLICTGY